MESHPLNLAHQQYRRAEAHLKYNRFDEAMQCHHNAAELLLDAMKSTSSSMALESITLQHSYHLKQKDLIQTKKEQYARVRKAVENLKQLGRDPNLPTDDNSKIEVAIFRNLNETDSLLGLISNRHHTNDNIDGKPIEKDQAKVIDELQTLNRNLHSFVEQMVTHVEMLKDENMTLNERVRYLEKERTKYLTIPTSEFVLQNNFSNISLASEAYPQVSMHTDLPMLAGQLNRGYGTGVARPIQQPHFDLSAFKDD